jgi:Tfp pilus assembly protein PilF
MKKNFLALGVLVILGALTYANALHGPFMFDDHDFFDDTKKNIRNIPVFFLPDGDNIIQGTTALGHNLFYRPLSKVVPMLPYLIFRSNVFALHVFNLILWTAAAWMVFLFLNGWLGSFWLALLTAALFLVHPINGLAVNYITASVFSAQVILMIASLRFLSSKLLSVLFFVLSLMCHESAMVLPFYAVLIMVWGKGQDWKEAFKVSWPLWLTLVMYFIWRLYFCSLSKGLLNQYGNFSMNIFEFAATDIKLMCWYLERLVFPPGMVMIYTSPVLRGLAVWGWLIFGMGLGVAIFKGLQGSSKVFTLGAAWLVLGFLPFLPASLFQPTRHVLLIESHWMVFASIGFFMVIAYVLTELWKKERSWAGAGGVLLFAVLIFSAWQSNALWADEITYGQYWLSQTPSFSAIHTLLGRAYQERGLYDKARQQWRLGLTSDKRDQLGYFINMGLMDFNQDHYDAAMEEFTQAVKFNPRDEMAYNDIGAIYYKRGQIAEARKYFAAALELNPKSPLPHLNWGELMLRIGRQDEAISSFERALSLSPGNKDALANLASIGMRAQKSGDEKTASRIYNFLMQAAPHGQ